MVGRETQSISRPIRSGYYGTMRYKSSLSRIPFVPFSVT
jgi:hypothetical protein